MSRMILSRHTRLSTAAHTLAFPPNSSTMSSDQQAVTIKVEEPQDRASCHRFATTRDLKLTLGQLSRIYLHSVTVPGIPAACRQFDKPCSFPYTSGTSNQQNEIPITLLRSILSDHLPAKASNVILQWRLTASTEGSYPVITTRHKITDTTSMVDAQNYTIVFAERLDRLQKITSSHQRLRKSQQDSRAQLKTSYPSPPLLTGAGKISPNQYCGISKRRRRRQLDYTQQPCPAFLSELRRRAEQHSKATGEVSCLLRVMQVQQYIMSGKSSLSTCHKRDMESRSISPSDNSVCSE